MLFQKRILSIGAVVAIGALTALAQTPSTGTSNKTTTKSKTTAPKAHTAQGSIVTSTNDMLPSTWISSPIFKVLLVQPCP